MINVADALAAYRQNGGGTKTGASTSSDSAGASESFGDMLKDFGGDVVNTLDKGEKAAQAGALGKADLTGVVTAISNAEMMLQTVVTIRDKVIAAYQDISKTAI